MVRSKVRHWHMIRSQRRAEGGSEVAVNVSMTPATTDLSLISEMGEDQGTEPQMGQCGLQRWVHRKTTRKS